MVVVVVVVVPGPCGALPRPDVLDLPAASPDVSQVHPGPAVCTPVLSDARHILAASGVAGQSHARSVHRRLSPSLSLSSQVFL